MSNSRACVLPALVLSLALLACNQALGPLPTPLPSATPPPTDTPSPTPEPTRTPYPTDWAPTLRELAEVAGLELGTQLTGGVTGPL
jgi:hypothetical protein